jgi:hypothetical protein
VSQGTHHLCWRQSDNSDAYRTPFALINAPNSPAERWTATPYQRGVTLKLIAAGKADPECLHQKLQWEFRDKCLNDHYFRNFAQARAALHGGQITTRRDPAVH